MLNRRIAAVVAGVMLTGCAAMNSQTNAYATLDEARSAGAVTQGWIPDGLPEGTSDLREAHESGGPQWGIFSFPTAGENTLRRLMGNEITASPPRCNPPGRFEWWPRLLRSPIDLSKTRTAGLQLYTGRDGRTYAVNWMQGRAYYWKE